MFQDQKVLRVHCWQPQDCWCGPIRRSLQTCRPALVPQMPLVPQRRHSDAGLWGPMMSLWFFFSCVGLVDALQIQCYQCEEMKQDCSAPEYVVNCTVNVQDMCQKEVLVRADGQSNLGLFGFGPEFISVTCCWGDVSLDLVVLKSECHHPFTGRKAQQFCVSDAGFSDRKTSRSSVAPQCSKTWQLSTPPL